MGSAWYAYSRLFLCVLCVAVVAACAPPRSPAPAVPSASPEVASPQRAGDVSQPRELRGWERPYEVFGERYHPLLSHEGFVEEGFASWYGQDFHGKKTSNGEIYDMYAMTAAHKTLPLGIHVKVTNLDNGSETILRLNDRGPFVKGRIIDLSYTAAKKLDVVRPGTAPVRVEALGYRQVDSSGQVSYTQPQNWEVGSYSVQLGAFTIRENAQRLADQMQRQEGHSSIHQGYVGGQLFYRVRAGKYPTLASADAAKLRFESQGYSGSFVIAAE